MISEYNAEPHAVKNLMQVVWKELRVYGFIVGSLYPKVRPPPFPLPSPLPHPWLTRAQYRERFYAEFPAAVAAGKIRYLEDATRGLEGAGEAIVAVQKGANHGKKVVVLADA